MGQEGFAHRGGYGGGPSARTARSRGAAKIAKVSIDAFDGADSAVCSVRNLPIFEASILDYGSNEVARPRWKVGSHLWSPCSVARCIRYPPDDGEVANSAESLEHSVCYLRLHPHSPTTTCDITFILTYTTPCRKFCNVMLSLAAEIGLFVPTYSGIMIAFSMSFNPVICRHGAASNLPSL
jgi:hypothetical protein